MSASLLAQPACGSPAQPAAQQQVQPQALQPGAPADAPALAETPIADGVTPVVEAAPAPEPDLQISQAALRAAIDSAIERDEEQLDPGHERYKIDSFLALLAIEELTLGAPGGPSFTRVDGRPGYQIAGVAPGSIYARLGLQDGDIIEAIDGVPLDTPGRALLSISDRSRYVELTIARGDETRRVEYVIRTGLWRTRRYRPQRERVPRPDDLFSDLFRDSSSTSTGGGAESAPDASAPSLVDPFAPPTRSSREIPGAAEAIQCDANEEHRTCTVKIAFAIELLSNPAQLTRQARVIPSIRDGESNGFKFYGIRPGSLPKLLGMKNGDLVTHVNGQPLGDLDAAMKIYSSMKNAGSLKDATTLELSIERKGKPVRLDIEFR